MCYVDRQINFKLKPVRKFLLIKISLIIIVVMSLIFMFGIVNVFRFEVKKIDVYSENLPSAFDGLKVVQFSDLHLISWFTRAQLQRPIDAINQLSPDVIPFYWRFGFV